MRSQRTTNAFERPAFPLAHVAHVGTFQRLSLPGPVHTHAHLCAHTHAHLCTHACTRTHTRVHTHTCTPVHTCMHMHARTCTPVYTHMRTQCSVSAHGPRLLLGCWAHGRTGAHGSDMGSVWTAPAPHTCDRDPHRWPFHRGGRGEPSGQGSMLQGRLRRCKAAPGDQAWPTWMSGARPLGGEPPEGGAVPGQPASSWPHMRA